MTGRFFRKKIREGKKENKTHRRDRVDKAKKCLERLLARNPPLQLTLPTLTIWRPRLEYVKPGRWTQNPG